MIYFSPYSPAQVDFHSTLKYLTRLPEMLERLEEEGVEPRLSASIGFMSKMTSKRDHETSHSLAREVYASNILDSSLPRLDGFERCGESLTLSSVLTLFRIRGSAEALKKLVPKRNDLLKPFLTALNTFGEHLNEKVLARGRVLGNSNSEFARMLEGDGEIKTFTLKSGETSKIH